MSEKAPVAYEANNFVDIAETHNARGARIYKGVDAAGVETNIAADQILIDSGYNPATSRPSIRDKAVDEAGSFQPIKWKAPSGRSETGSGIADSETNELQKAYADAAKKHARKSKEEAVENRQKSPEVSLLNDAAELAIKGSGNRVYTNAAGEIIAAPHGHKENGVPVTVGPMKGIIEKIREDRSYGTTEALRNAAADKYEADISGLVDGGLELTQALLVMNERQADSDAIKRMAGQLEGTNISGEGNGLYDAATARTTAEEIYAKKEAKRIEMIKSEGIMTKAEYDAFMKDRTSPLRPSGTPADVAGGGADDEPSDYEKAVEKHRKALEEIGLTPDELEQMDKSVNDATVEWAKQAANSSLGYKGRFAKGNTLLGRLAKKIPGAQKLIDKVNSKTDQDSVIARAEQERLEEVVGSKVIEALEKLGHTPEEIRDFRLAATIKRDRLFEEEMLKETNANSKDATKLSNFWHRSSSKKAKIVKAAVAGAAGLAAGALTGGIAPILLGGSWIVAGGAGMVGGALGGGSVGVHVNRRRAKSVVGEGTFDGEPGTVTVAQRRAQVSLAAKEALVQANHDAGNDVSSVLSNKYTDKLLDEEMARNRSRVRQAASVGKLATGGIAGLAANSLLGLGRGDLSGVGGAVKDAGKYVWDRVDDFIPGIGDNGWIPFVGDGGSGSGSGGNAFVSTGTPNPDAYVPEGGYLPSTPDGSLDELGSGSGVGGNGVDLNGELPASNAGTLQTLGDQVDLNEVNTGQSSAVSEIAGNEFNVEAGNGFIAEINDLAQANDINVDDQMVAQVYEAARERFGNDLLSTSEYLQGNDLRIGAPGMTSWNPGVAQFMTDQLRQLAEASSDLE